ncbi:MAG: sodium-dependent bicarbonate transport family permease [Rhodobacter sp.]|nr:sodium-dependent bicarbonate transport family permease [Rhodobacter sp.]
MEDILALAIDNLVSPIILSFVLGLFAAIARSDLSMPEAIAKGISIYLMFAIGFKGGVSVGDHGIGSTLGPSLVAGVFLAFALPLIAYGLMRVMTRLSPTDAAATAGHYGSVSIVTFVAAASVLEANGVAAEGFMIAIAAAMEAPAIISALWLAARVTKQTRVDTTLLRDMLLNGSIVLLIGAFLIGLSTGQDGLDEIGALIGAPFKGVLCLFLLDMGLIAGRGLRSGKGALGPGAVGFGMVMPMTSAAVALATAMIIGLSPGGTALLMTMAASASYIAVPAAMRVALPQANPSVSLTLALGVTFPFNLIFGIPLYIAAAAWMTGG